MEQKWKLKKIIRTIACWKKLHQTQTLSKDTKQQQQQKKLKPQAKQFRPGEYCGILLLLRIWGCSAVQTHTLYLQGLHLHGLHPGAHPNRHSLHLKPTEQLHHSRWGLNGSFQGTQIIDRQHRGEIIVINISFSSQIPKPSTVRHSSILCVPFVTL